MASKFAAADIAALKRIIAQLSADPQLIHDGQLSFLKSFLAAGGFSVPTAKAAAAAAGEFKVPPLSAFEDSDEDDVDDDMPGLEEDEPAKAAEPEELPEGCVEPDAEPYPPLPTPPAGELTDAQYDEMGDAGEKANEAKGSGDYEAAVAAYTVILGLEPSPSTFAKRALCLLDMATPRPNAAIRDCDEALKRNPDSAKSMKVRGRAYRMLGKWEEAAKDLRSAMRIDPDPKTQTLQKEVEKWAQKIAARKNLERIENEKKERKRVAAERHRRQEEAAAAKAAAAAGGGMPGMGGGMPGMGGGMPAGMGEAMKNPKIMAALQSMMSGDPAKMAEAMKDPEVAAFMAKMKGQMGGMGGGMGGGMPGAGAAHGHGHSHGAPQAGHGHAHQHGAACAHDHDDEVD